MSPGLSYLSGISHGNWGYRGMELGNVCFNRMVIHVKTPLRSLHHHKGKKTPLILPTVFWASAGIAGENMDTLAPATHTHTLTQSIILRAQSREKKSEITWNTLSPFPARYGDSILKTVSQRGLSASFCKPSTLKGPLQSPTWQWWGQL